MAAEELQLRTDGPLLRQIGEQLIAEEMGVHTFRDPSRDRILLDNLAETPRGVGLTPSRFEQVEGILGALSFNILREFSPEVGPNPTLVSPAAKSPCGAVTGISAK